MPKVTVLIPVYNRERYLRDAIDSLLAQTFTDFELLIIDDGSTDSSRELVRAYEDARIRLLCNEQNQGIPATRNRGIKEARGEYLAFLDSDDRALPERLARQVAFLDHHPDYAAVGSWVEWMDEAGRPLGRIKRKTVDANRIAAERLFRSGLQNPTVLAHTKILRAYGHREDLALGSDYDLWARVATDFKLTNLPQVLVYCRTHCGRTTEGQVERIKGWRLQIFAWQLKALGVPFTADDLERHYLLRRMGKLKFRPGTVFLDWAETWLLGLRSANQITGLYPEPAFSEMMGIFWLKTCWHAAGGRSLGRRFWASPLYTLAWRGLFQLMRTQIRVRLPWRPPP